MTAAILGGAGNPRGALAGGVALGIFAAFSDYLLDARWTPVLLMLLLIGLLAFRPGGLLGRAVAPASEEVTPATPAAVVRRGGPYGRRLLIGLLAFALAYPILDQIGAPSLREPFGAETQSDNEWSRRASTRKFDMSRFRIRRNVSLIHYQAST